MFHGRYAGRAGGWAGGSDRVGAALPGSDPDGFVDRRDEDLSIADTARLGRLLDGVDHTLAE